MLCLWTKTKVHLILPYLECTGRQEAVEGAGSGGWAVWSRALQIIGGSECGPNELDIFKPENVSSSPNERTQLPVTFITTNSQTQKPL